MTELDLSSRLRSVLVDEPADPPDLASVLDAGGARRRRRSLLRRSTVAVGACAVAGVAAVAVPSLVGGAEQQLATSGPGAVSAATGGAGATTAVQGRRPTDPLDARIAAAIESVTPASWVLDLPSGDSSPGNVDGTADDGAGPGRIYVWTSTGTQLLHPCQDSEFRQGGSCREQTLADGSVLARRGLVTAANGVQTYLVVLSHPDGSGVGAEAGNFTIGPRPEVLTPDDKEHLVKVTRTHPTYDLAQLTVLVKAVAAATD